MKEFDQLVKIVETLRSKEGCKWDRAQRLGDIKAHIIEEAYELIDAIDRRDTQSVKEELGDLFLLLVFTSQLYRERKKLKVEDALRGINTKLITRHPHVFSSKKLRSRKEILTYWIQNKAKTKKRKVLTERLPQQAPALLLAALLFKERTHVENAAPAKNASRRLHRKARMAEKAKTKRNMRKALISLLVEICECAFIYHIDLETALRKEILQEAKKVRY